MASWAKAILGDAVFRPPKRGRRFWIEPRPTPRPATAVPEATAMRLDEQALSATTFWRFRKLALIGAVIAASGCAYRVDDVVVTKWEMCRSSEDMDTDSCVPYEPGDASHDLAVHVSVPESLEEAARDRGLARPFALLVPCDRPSDENTMVPGSLKRAPDVRKRVVGGRESISYRLIFRGLSRDGVERFPTVDLSWYDFGDRKQNVCIIVRAGNMLRVGMSSPPTRISGGRR